MRGCCGYCVLESAYWIRYTVPMDPTGLYDSIYAVSHYAPLVIVVAACLDIFFMTGLLLYGIAMMSTVGMMHMSGMISTEELLLSAFAGTVIGNVTNYWYGRLFGETAFIKKRLESKRLQPCGIVVQPKSVRLAHTA